MYVWKMAFPASSTVVHVQVKKKKEQENSNQKPALGIVAHRRLNECSDLHALGLHSTAPLLWHPSLWSFSSSDDQTIKRIFNLLH
jgi:hypothetical protein